MRELLRLKSETPRRVILIAGNRDMNKVRLRCELSAEALELGPAYHRDDWQQWLREQGLRDDRNNRLRWILARTMGAPAAFELRRQELAEERGFPVDDDTVTESFIDEMAPGGMLECLLRLSVPMWRIGPTLFVHGGLSKENLCVIPQSAPAKELNQWIQGLNDWYRRQLLHWRSEAKNWNGKRPQPGIELVRYGMKTPSSSVNPDSVAYNRTVDETGKVRLPDDEVISFLQANGITRLVVGHTPSGSFPVILRTSDGSFETIVADTSRAQFPERPALITITGPGLAQTRIRGALPRGNTLVPIEVTTTIGQPSPIGSLTADGSIVVAMQGQIRYTYRLEPGFKVVYEASCR